ncbi:MAG: PQQ-dependent sugar dehydrogenase [Pyrinomonadaceae bacterium]|nr:PQQ-dependent sugar dehydrogenase [Phycisphaerales bacterium]
MLIRLATAALSLAFAAAAFANVPPLTPVITEPIVDGHTVNAADCHMETGAFSDPDAGDTHRCTDWEIWTISPAQRIWFTSCITGVERVHTHLGDGVFENSHAGRLELIPGTQYRVRVRFRDSSNDPATEWSPYAQRLFQTGPATQVFPLEAEDILPSPAPAWVTAATSQPQILPGAGAPSFILEGHDLESLLEIHGFDGLSNTVTNPKELQAHGAIRVHVSAGSMGSALLLPETNLTFSTHEGAHTIYVPAMSVQPGVDQYFWVAESGATYIATQAQTKPVFATLARGNPVPWAVRQAGYRVEVVASGFQLPVNIAFVPNPGPNPNSPLYYVTELYGAIKVVTRDGTVRDYATNLLNYNPGGAFPGSGEQGITGIVVDPLNGDVYAGMLYDALPPNGPHYPKVVRYTSTDGGLTAATQTVILNMPNEPQGQSHQISNMTFGPDDKLYVHMGDGFDTGTAQNLNSFRGKILRLNRSGTATNDNPFYNAGDGISARDYVFAYGVRNPFGGAWRDSDGAHYEVENGPSVDRFAKIVRGRNYLYNGSDQSMTNFSLYTWTQAVGPVNIAFIQPTTHGGSQFPAGKQGHAYVSESGATWGTGPQSVGKKITEWVIDASGNLVSGPSTLVEYVGTGKATVVGLAAGPDGLYFTDLYKDLDYTSPIDRGANVLRVRFVGDAEFSANVVSGSAPLMVSFTDLSTVPSPTSWLWNFGDGATSSQQNPTHTYTDDGIYTVRLSVTGSAGLSIEEKLAYVRVGTVPVVALIGNSIPPGAADAAIAEHLSNLGYLVTAYDDEPGSRPTAAELAADNGLVIVSSSIASGNVAGEFRDVNVPLIFWENAMLRSGRESLMDNGIVAGGTSIDITSNTHPITAGLSLGTLPVFSQSSNMSLGLGNTGPQTQILARRTGSTDAALIVAGAGAIVADSYVTPARRVFLFFEDSSWQNATPIARTILERSVCWAMNLTSPVVLGPPDSVKVAVGQSASFTVTVQGSTPITYRWRHNGQPIPGATTRTFTIPEVVTSDAGEYDVVVSNTCGTATSSSATLTIGILCACDWNQSGSITSQDFFDFIAGFFNNNADFNNSGITDSQDFFDFVACFFSGC